MSVARKGHAKYGCTFEEENADVRRAGSRKREDMSSLRYELLTRRLQVIQMIQTEVKVERGGHNWSPLSSTR